MERRRRWEKEGNEEWIEIGRRRREKCVIAELSLV